MIRDLVIGSAVVYVCVGLALTVFQRRLIYVPDTSVPQRSEFGAVDYTEVRYRTEDGIDLFAWHRPPRRPGFPTILYLHGNAGHIGHRIGKAAPYVKAGYGIFLAEYRGYGGNGGRPEEAGLYRDARAAMAALQRDGVAAGQVVLYGESLGGAVAVEIARHFPVRALVLEAPVASVSALGKRRFPMFPVGLLLRDRYEAVDSIAGVEAPLLVLHGEKDGIVPVSHGKTLHARATGVKKARYYPEAGHNDLYDFGAFNEVLAFLATQNR